MPARKFLHDLAWNLSIRVTRMADTPARREKKRAEEEGGND